jgi:ketosteroid isomerase-like protein
MLRSLSTALSLFVACIVSACTPQHISVAAESDSVRARSEAVTAAEAAMDRDKAMSFWAEDAIYQPVSAPQVQGRDTISQLYKRYLETSGIKIVSGKASQIVVSQSGDLAYETGVNRYTYGTPKGDVLDVGKYLLVWKKVGGKWYIAAISASSDAPAPVAIK